MDYILKMVNDPLKTCRYIFNVSLACFDAVDLSMKLSNYGFIDQIVHHNFYNEHEIVGLQIFSYTTP